MQILLTAFEPFSGNTTNITQLVMNELPEQIGPHYLHKVVLPVSFKRAPVALHEAIEQVQPDMVIMLGQCKEGEKIRLERFAHNMMDSQMGDNDHYCPLEKEIYPSAPVALTTTISPSLNTMAQSISTAHLPVMTSSSAGLYVCNRVYYEALYSHQTALFVHVPKNMEVDMATRVLSLLVQNL